MKSELIVDVQPQEIAIALTEDDRLQEVARERRDQDNFAVGNIYYGRVKKVMPALNAVFVDVGHEKEAFLHYLDLGSQFRTLQSYVTKAVSDRRRVPLIQKIQRQPEVGKEGQIADVLKVGDPILVQVSKEPINTKGPRLTAEISIAGRNIVLIPFADGVMVSQKIKREAERQRLKQLMLSVKPQGFGVIVRTVAEDKRVAELDNELRLLVERWEETIKTLQHSEPVSLVSEEMGRTLGIIRDVLSPDFTSIQINDRDIYDDVRNYLELIVPESAKIVKLYQGTQPIFDHFDITRQMKTGLGRTVGFKHGGYLIIDKTEALFSIDVNSGSKKLYEDQEENAFQFNMLAADELVHQLRLRDIGGIIIVDFIDMDTKEHQQQLYDYVRKLMERDRAKHNVLPLSKFGLMQITRQRVRPAVEVDVMETCPTCMGKGRIQPSILFNDQIAEECEHMSEHYGRGLQLHLHPYIYAYVSRGWFTSLKAQWRRRFGVRVIENQALGMLEMRFYDAKGNLVKHPQNEIPQEEETPKQVKETPKQETKKAEQKKIEQPQPKKEEQPQSKKAEQPKVYKPQETEVTSAEQPKKKASRRKKAAKQQAPKTEASQQPKASQPEKSAAVDATEQPKKAKRSRSAAKPKASPVEPAEKSAAETKAPASVKRRARKQNAQAVAQKNNGEN
ncbi:MAG: Rne/Rng family ribonuclease [Paludibacteraceae bacterium]|nr:Rne/Rng family ribonuclease [Paludibacteraceae bacterium]